MAAVSPKITQESTVHIIYCVNYNDNLHYCLPHKCIIVVQHLVFHTSIEKLSAALKEEIHPQTESAQIPQMISVCITKHSVYKL